VNLINKHMTVVIEKKQVMSEIVMNFSTGDLPERSDGIHA